MPAWLAALAVAALVFYTDDYVVAGVLPEIAAEFDVTVGTAGQLVTVFSLAVALGAPIAAVATARVQPRRVLASAAAVFVLANAAAATAPAFAVLMGARVAAALAAAAATPALFSLAARLAPPERLGRYVAVVALGVTGAIAIGVPVGTWLSALGGWRTTFCAMAGAGMLVLICFIVLLPARTELGEPLSVIRQVRILAAPQVSLGLAANVTLMFGSMMLLTYLAPFAADLASVGLGLRGSLFAASGVAGMVGIWAGGRATDRLGPDRALAIGVGAFVSAMAAFAVLWVLRPVPVALLYPLVMVWCGAAFWNSPAAQARLHRLAGRASTQALALNTSGTYVGVALGGAVGGAIIAIGGSGPLPAVAACASLGALLLFRLATRCAPAAARSKG